MKSCLKANPCAGRAKGWPANPLIARYTTLQQRVDAGMLRFGLAPAGRETGKTPEQPADPFDQFDGPAAGVAASVN